MAKKRTTRDDWADEDDDEIDPFMDPDEDPFMDPDNPFRDPDDDSNGCTDKRGSQDDDCDEDWD